MATTDKLTFLDLGIQPYRQVYALQQQIWQRRLAGECADTVIFVEHPPVITLGARKSENKLRVPPEELNQRGIDTVAIGRGGGVTAHNPGQLVIYPILDLKSLAIGINEYVRQLEAVGMEILLSFGVDAQRRKGFPGLWTGQQKIASVGVQVRRWICFHGIAINLNNDLSIFDYIVPCGLEGVRMTSAAEQLGKPVDIQRAKQVAAMACQRLWHSSVESAAV